ncbi:hypothetical protein RhiirA4_451380 [Rhizophagus irregularis]|uniref:DUF7431 domain-containing protein n=1 Tax=Rhizophagus irregularis TaxID=588596 RepID=A0A2I1FVH9_9GLOM|nr:hypothetical protein RhiirA4_451380 [Rhizophagus irregularis]
MASTKIRIIIKENGTNDSQSLLEVQLVLTDKLSEIREKLEIVNKMDDKLSFSQKFDDESVEISRVEEEYLSLVDIIDKVSYDINILYLIKSAIAYWKFLNKLHRLDWGCTMTSEGIKRANERAFKMLSVEIAEIDTKKDSTIEFSSYEDWIMKKNLFFNSDMNVKYFTRLSAKKSMNENYKVTSSHKYRVCEKVSLKICNLKATKNFMKELNDAINSKDLKNFEKITEKFGQFIPIEVIFGKRFQIENTTTQTNHNMKSLDYCRNWDCIEFRKPSSIFQLVDNDLREKLYSFFGKRILYLKITTKSFKKDDNNCENVDDVKDDKYGDEDKNLEDDTNNKDDKDGNEDKNVEDGRNEDGDDINTKIIELPQRISEIISNKHADCSIFATVIGMNDYYHCQILTSSGKEQKLMIHCFKEVRKDSKLIIGWMVIGYDTNFKSIFSDSKDMQLDILRKNYIPYDLSNDKMFELGLLNSAQNHYCIGIPVIDKSDLLIGHNFSNDCEKLYTFSYSLREKRCVKLPKFSFDILVISNNGSDLILFEKEMNSNVIDFDDNIFKELKYVPNFISLCSKKGEQIFPKQRFTQIKVKFLDNKNSSKKEVYGIRESSDLKCLFFVPFESKTFRKFIEEISELKEIDKSKILKISHIKKLFETRKVNKSFHDDLDKILENTKERDNNNETPINNGNNDSTDDIKVQANDNKNSTDDIKDQTSNNNKVSTDDVKNKINNGNKAPTDNVKDQTNDDNKDATGDTKNHNYGKFPIINTNVPTDNTDNDSDNDSVELVPSPTDISTDTKIESIIPTGKSTIFSSSEIDENGNITTITTEIKPGKNGKSSTTVRKNMIDSKGITNFDLTTFFSELEENSSEGKEISESDKSMTILQGDQSAETSNSSKMTKKTKTYSKNETNDFGIVTSTTTEIKTDEDGKPTVTVATKKFIGNKDEKIPETTFSSSETDEYGNVTTTTTETTREDGKTETRVRIETKDLNNKTIYNESFVSRPEEISSDVNRDEKTLTDSFGAMKNKHKLDFGCTMTSNGIKRANQRAFITEKCEFKEIDITKYEEVKFHSFEDRMIKKNLFFVPNMNVKYFAKIGIKYENEYYDDIDENIIYKYRVYEKVSFKIQNLKATDDFIKRVNNALQLEDLKKFLQITEEYGQFIPTEVILGQRFKTDNEPKEKEEKEEKEDLLNDYRKRPLNVLNLSGWDTIELLEPISIFELVDDDLRERLYSFFGKRILYSKIETEVIGDDKNVKTKVIKLPTRISKIISNKHADCSIFATAIGLKDHYHCQILTSDKEPELIIHRLKEKSKSKDSELVIGWMVVGNDTNFKSIFPDYNTKTFNNTQFKVLKIDINDVVVNLNDLKPPTEKPYYIGIPYIDKSDLMIGHWFSNDREKLYLFSYSSKDEPRELPKFSFHLLVKADPSGIFEKNMNNLNNTINLDNIDEFKNFKYIPKFITLYSKKDERRSILLKQRPTYIKVKFPNNEPSFNEKVIGKLSDDNENLKCSFFIPFERGCLYFALQTCGILMTKSLDAWIWDVDFSGNSEIFSLDLDI